MALRPRCTLHLADNGERGITQAQDLQPGLVLIDLNLPDMSGFEVLRRLRQNAATRHLRCIALSADAMPDSIERARVAGFDDFWTKPIEVQAFLRGLDAQLKRA